MSQPDLSFKDLDKAFKKAKPTNLLQQSIIASIAVWESRVYQSSEWSEKNETHRTYTIELLESLLQSIESHGQLTAKQNELAKKLISNAKSLDPFLFKQVLSDPDSNKPNIETIKIKPSGKDIQSTMSTIVAPSVRPASIQQPAVAPTVSAQSAPVAASQSTQPQAQSQDPNSAPKIPTIPTVPEKKILKLPTKKSDPIVDLFPNTILFYGPNGTGKTPFWASCEKALFLMTEPGARGLSIWKMPEEKPCFTKWEDFEDACRLVLSAKHEFSPIVIDSLTGMVDLARPYALAPFGVKHENELDFGKGTAAINNVIAPVLKTLARSAYGLVMIGHSKTETVKTRAGEIKKTIISLPDTTRQLVMDLSDLILCIEVADTKMRDGTIKPQRTIYTSTSQNRVARDRYDRLPEKFLAEPKGSGYQKLFDNWNKGVPGTPKDIVSSSNEEQPADA